MMAGSTLPLWIILLIVGLISSIVISNINYYLPSMSKLKAECLRKKPLAQRNNYILNLKRRIDEEYFLYIALGIYIIVSICFCVENHEYLFSGEYIVIKVFIMILVWFVFALMASAILAALMMVCQEEAIRKLKNHYERYYGVLITNIDEDIEKEYQELSEF